MRELEMPPIPEFPKIPGLLDHLGELSFIQCTLQEYNNIPSPGSKTVYFVHSPSRLLKIMLGKQIIWFCEPDRIEYIPTEGFQPRSNILGFKSGGDIIPAGFPLNFTNQYQISDNRFLDRVVLGEVSYLKVVCRTPNEKLQMSSFANVVDLTALDTTEIKDMTSMCNFREITELDVSGFDTRYVTSMKSMFQGCRKLKKLNLEGFNTKNVKSFSSMFQDCSSLESLNVIRWDLNSGNDFSFMFKGCSSLENLNLSYWNNTFRFTSLYGMFEDCISLKSLNLSNFNTLGAREEAYIKTFYNCESLETLDISNFDFMMNKTQPIDMFFGCCSLKNLKFGKNYHKGDLWLYDCPLTHESAMSVINSLRETEKPTDLIFSHETYDTLTEEELALAVSLGFNVFAW